MKQLVSELVKRQKDLNIVNLSIILYNLLKIKHDNIEDWKVFMSRYFELLDDPSQLAIEMLDQTLVVMVLNAVSKVLKTRFKEFEKEFLFKISLRAMQLFENFGDGRFDKKGLIMALQSLGRFQEIYKKTNPA